MRLRLRRIACRYSQVCELKGVEATVLSAVVSSNTAFPNLTLFLMGFRRNEKMAAQENPESCQSKIRQSRSKLAEHDSQKDLFCALALAGERPQTRGTGWAGATEAAGF